uniref:ULP_PROTEASE domain-containing protein n=1 Tax=Brugia timori TaxID=42155 RepID=A0A0R3QNM9_9BILA
LPYGDSRWCKVLMIAINFKRNRSRVDCLLKTQNIRVGIHVNTFRKFVVDDRSNSCRHCNQSQ